MSSFCFDTQSGAVPAQRRIEIFSNFSTGTYRKQTTYNFGAFVGALLWLSSCIGVPVTSLIPFRDARPMSDHLLLLGDSVTVGAGFSGVDDESCYVALLKTELRSAGAQMNIRASALDGADTGYVLRRFDRMVARLSPDVIVISLGLNDARPPGSRIRNSPARYADNLQRLAEKSLAIDVRPILCTPPPRLDVSEYGQPAWKMMRPYAEAVRTVAEKYNLPLIELYDEFVSRQDLESLLPDRLHPGRAGHQLIARQFARTLVPFCTGRELEGQPLRRGQNFEFLAAD